MLPNFVGTKSDTMRVEKIMNTPVVTTQPNVDVAHLKETFKRQEIHAVPVMEEDGTIAGIVSSSDLIAVHNETLLARQIMTPKVHICLPNNRVKDAAKTMSKHGVHHMVVMEEGEIIGMVSSMDIVKAYAEEA